LGALKEIIVKMMVEVLVVFAVLMKEMEQGRAKKYSIKFLKALIGRNDRILAALARMDELSGRETAEAVAQIHEAVHHLLESDKKRTVREVEAERLAEIKKKQEKRDLVRKDRAWLSSPDPSINHNIKYETIIKPDGRTARRTTTWLIEGDVFVEWKSEPNSSFWIQGKVGSGKSVLCSAVIEHIMELQNAGRATLAYFYFDFNDDKKTNLDNVLRSLLTQLADRSDSYCDILSHIYERKNNGKSTPGADEMITCLEEMLKLPDQVPVYIILDALDECSNIDKRPSARTRVLNLLKRLVGLRLSSLHLCVTSRPEDDIGTALEAFSAISIQEQKGQKEDIEQYIKDDVYANSDTPTGRWDIETKYGC